MDSKLVNGMDKADMMCSISIPVSPGSAEGRDIGRIDD